MLRARQLHDVNRGRPARRPASGATGVPRPQGGGAGTSCTAPLRRIPTDKFAARHTFIAPVEAVQPGGRQCRAEAAGLKEGPTMAPENLGVRAAQCSNDLGSGRWMAQRVWHGHAVSSAPPTTVTLTASSGPTRTGPRPEGTIERWQLAGLCQSISGDTLPF